MNSTLGHRLSQIWFAMQDGLFPEIERQQGEILSPKLQQLIRTLEVARAEERLPDLRRMTGRPLAVYCGETMLRNGRVIGNTTSGNYGYTVGKSIVFGYVPVEHAQAGAFEIEAFGELSPAVRIDGCAYDPPGSAC